MKLNNKGFTLIELLGVLVILTTILLVGIPTIISTYERNKNKLDDKKIDIIKSASEIYASKYKYDDSFDYDSYLKGTCGITVSMLLDKGLITDDEITTSNNTKLSGFVTVNNGKLNYTNNISSLTKSCLK